MILPLALGLWPGVWVPHTPGHLRHPMRPFSSTRGSSCSVVLAWEAGVLRRLCPPQVHLPCSHPLRGLASSQSRTVGQGGPASWEPQTSAPTHLGSCSPARSFSNALVLLHPWIPGIIASVGLGFHKRKLEPRLQVQKQDTCWEREKKGKIMVTHSLKRAYNVLSSILRALHTQREFI